ncbi:hypothetical protein [Kaistella sp.]|uniref:hypothetical protein n=1 Tax=Kaistella sp. TaxID=2782235 RepID=UPI003C5E8FAC
MKKLLFSILLCSLSAVTYAQNKEIEAIATYQMAEENFENKNFTNALKYVSDAQSILGKSNGKMLYLKIQVLEELSKADPQYLLEQEATITEFEKIAAKEQFSHEKRVEIAKKKILLKDQINAYQEKTHKEKLADEQNRLVIENFFTIFPKLNIPVADFLDYPAASRLKMHTSKKDIKTLEKGAIFGLPNELLFTDNQESQKQVAVIATDENGSVTNYMLLVELPDDNLSGLYDMLQISNQNFSLHNVKQKKRLTADTFFDGYEIKTAGLKPYLFIDRSVYTTENRYRRNGKRKNLNYARIYVQSK